MSGAFTPGPWRATAFSSVVGCPIMAQPDPKRNSVIVAGVHGAFGDDYQGEVEANAALIASAPELLNALERMVAVIHMAGVGNLMNGVQLGQVSWGVKMNDALEMARAAIAKATQVQS